MSRRAWILLGAVLATLAVLIAWRVHTLRTASATQERRREARLHAPPTVGVAIAGPQQIVNSFSTVGSVDSPNTANLAPKTTGRLVYLVVREGDAVTQGEVLARLDPAAAEAQLHQQQAALAEAQQRLAQAQIQQAPTNVGVNTQIAQAEQALATAQANYGQLAANFDAQVAAAESAVTDAAGRVSAAVASQANARAAIKSAEANLANAKAAYSRSLTLYKQGYIAPQDLDTASTAVEVQRGALDVARSQLNSAEAARQSALAQQRAAENQLSITRTKGQADIRAAQAQVDQAKAALQLARANTAQKPAYQANLAALRAQVNAARAAVADAQASLNDTIIKSPLTGYVTARYVDPGALVSPSQPILAVASIRQVWVTLSVPEDIHRALTLGQTGAITFDALPGRTYTGTITQINRAADPTTRQFNVRLTLDNPRGEVIPGMSAQVTLVTQRVSAAVAVPPEAIQHSAGGATVFVVGPDNELQQRGVTVGASDANAVQIIGGVAPGERVVVLTSVPLRSGQKVRVAGADAPAGRHGPSTGGAP